jgi:hypothetical protein
MDRYGIPSPSLRGENDRVLLWFAMVGDLRLGDSPARVALPA